MEGTALLLSVISAFTALIIIRWAVKRYTNLRFFSKHGIKGPRPSFIFGNALQLKFGGHNAVVTGWLKKYGDVVGYYLGDRPYLLINDTQVLKQVLVKDFQFFTQRPPLFIDMPPIDKTIFSVNTQRWKEVRSILSPTFSSGKIKLMSTIIDKKIDITLDVLEKKANDNEIFDIYEMMQALTLDVIADCAFGMKTRCQDNPKDYFLNAARDFVRFNDTPLILLSLAFPFVSTFLMFLSQFLTAGQMTRYILNHLSYVIKNRRNNPSARCVDLLQLMINSSEGEVTKENKITPLSDIEVAGNAYAFLIAGYETTSTALGFTFYSLVTHPDVQEKLHQEINQTEDSSYNTVQGLQYLDQVFSEILRIFPPVTGFVSRISDKDCQVGNTFIPKGAQVVVPVWDIHHDPELWPEPFKFDPERFSLENKTKIPNMAYLPFGAGPRNCIGARFAQLEAKHAIVKILKKFRFEKCEKTEDNLSLKCVNGILTQPSNGVWVRAIPRN